MAFTAIKAPNLDGYGVCLKFDRLVDRPVQECYHQKGENKQCERYCYFPFTLITLRRQALLAEKHLWIVSVLSPFKEWTNVKSNRNQPDENYDSHSAFGKRAVMRQRQFNDGVVSPVIRHCNQMKDCVNVEVPLKECI